MTFSKRPPLCWKASSRPPLLTLSISLGMMPPACQFQAVLRSRQAVTVHLAAATLSSALHVEGGQPFASAVA